MTTFDVLPVRISRPPMMTGMSARSFAIRSRRALSSTRSGDPGAYDLTGSLIGVGTLRTAFTPVSCDAEDAITTLLIVGAAFLPLLDRASFDLPLLDFPLLDFP